MRRVATSAVKYQAREGTYVGEEGDVEDQEVEEEWESYSSNEPEVAKYGKCLVKVAKYGKSRQGYNIRNLHE